MRTAFIVFFVGIPGLLYAFFLNLPTDSPRSFEECVQAGNPVMESYPRQCRAIDETLFVEDIEIPTIPDIAPRSPGAYDGCIIGGCGSHICSDENLVTTCEFRPEYACFKSAICERGENNECAWRNTDEFTLCLSGAE